MTWLLASVPILVVLVLMAGFRWGGAKAGPVGWLSALIVAVVAFGAGPRLLFYSQVRGLLLSLYVLYIIWFALALYHVVNEAGAIQVISGGVARLTADRTMQLLILSWVFSSFLQGVTGFGVPMAVVAPLLIGLGFNAVTAVVAASIGHAWAVTFGSVASSMYAMIAVTGIEGARLAPWSAALLGVTCVACGLTAAYLHRGWASLRHSLLAVVVVGSAMAGTQYLMATHGLWPLAAFGGGLVGLVVVTGVARLPLYQGTSHCGLHPTAGEPIRNTRYAIRNGTLFLALSAYLILLVVVIVAKLVPPFPDLLDRVQIAVDFPQTQTALGWVNPAGRGRTISVFGHPGALLLYTCLMAYAIYRQAGCYTPGAAQRIVRQTIRGSIPSTIGILSMVGLALIMDNTGMTFVLAQGLSNAVGAAFPFLAPFVGALGAFMTGSNTNSNVLFAPLQQRTATLLGVNTLLILGAQNVGGAVGSVFAPAKVIVGCSTAGLGGREGEVLKLNLFYGMLIIAVMGLLTFGLALWL
jgi:lactate permease